MPGLRVGAVGASLAHTHLCTRAHTPPWIRTATNPDSGKFRKCRCGGDPELSRPVTPVRWPRLAVDTEVTLRRSTWGPGFQAQHRCHGARQSRPGVQRNAVLPGAPHSRAPYRPASCTLCCKLTFPGPGLLGGLAASLLAVNWKMIFTAA